jgi:phosphoribosylformylglycinamidine cyclo-ligase
LDTTSNADCTKRAKTRGAAAEGWSRIDIAVPRTYEQAGVSLGKAEEVVGRLRAAVESTRTAPVVGGLGGFAGLFALDDERLLAASTDGVGTKLVLARRAGRLRDCGADLAAHCINDVATTGAEPLFFLDYVAAGRLDLDQVAELVEGAADVCRAAGCAILGGETAELPGVYHDQELDIAGTCVGLVERAKLVDGSRVEEGDVVLGLASSGLHANGFSLVRSLVGDGPFDADLLLVPTRCYLDDMRRLREGCDLRALAHVTGGGIPGNLARVLPAGLGAVIDPASWERPAVFSWLDAQGVSEEEQRRVFNLGIGYCAIVPARDAGRSGLPVIGRVVSGVDGVLFA